MPILDGVFVVSNTSDQGQSCSSIDTSHAPFTIQLFGTIDGSVIFLHNVRMLDLTQTFRLNPFLKFQPLNSRTCSKHLILSPGAIITVVNTPDSIPAANNCGKLVQRKIQSILLFRDGPTNMLHVGQMVSVTSCLVHSRRRKWQTWEWHLWWEKQSS